MQPAPEMFAFVLSPRPLGETLEYQRSLGTKSKEAARMFPGSPASRKEKVLYETKLLRKKTEEVIE